MLDSSNKIPSDSNADSTIARTFFRLERKMMFCVCENS